MINKKSLSGLTAAITMLLASQLNAAIIGPDAFGYTAMEVTSEFQDISGSGTRVMAGADDQSIFASIGFSFSFYGTSHTSLYISSNGLLSFVSPNSSFTNQNLSLANLSMPVISPLWDDWAFFGSGDAAYYQTIGTVGSRQFVAQWNEAVHFNTTSQPLSVTFQAVLFEGSDDILFRYLDVDTGGNFSSGASATVGIADALGALSGRNLLWSFNSAALSVGQAILFTSRSFEEPVEVPEASTLALLSLGLMGFGFGSLLSRHRKVKPS